MQELINKYNYWDARVKQLSCDYFADEITLTYENEESEIEYRFVSCYKSIFNHVKSYDKWQPIKNMSIPQIPYFLQEVTIGEVLEEGIYFYTCKINMFPLYLEVWSKDIKVISNLSSNNLQKTSYFHFQ